MGETVEIQDTFQEPTQSPPPPDPPKKKLWKKLSEKQLYTKSYEDFEKQFSSPESIDKLYGVLSKKQLYTKTVDDFKNQFFQTQPLKKKSARIGFEESSLEAGNALSQSGGVAGSEIPTVEMHSTPSGEIVETDPVSLSRKYKQLSEAVKPVSDIEMGMSRGMAQPVIDEEKIKEAEKLKKDFPDIDFEGINEDTKDLSDDLLIKYKRDVLPDKETNNPLYQRKLSNIKWRSGIEKSLIDLVDRGGIPPDAYNLLKDQIDKLPATASSGDYSNQRDAIKSVANTIQLYGGENKEEILKNFATEAAKIYGNPFNKTDKSFKDTPESKYLDDNAQLGYQYLSDIDPSKAEQYKRLFIDKSLIKNDPDQKAGYDHLMLKLEETGLALKQNAITEELNSLNNIAQKQGGLSPEQIERASKLEEERGKLTQQSNELDSKYPERITDKVDDAIQEIMGQRIGLGSYAAGKAWIGIRNTGKGVWEAVSAPFMSDQSNVLRELAIMGEGLDEEKVYRKTNRNKSINYDEMVFQPELQKQIDDIKNNNLLTTEQKENKLYTLLKENTDKFGRVPIKGGKFNISGSSIMYGLTDLGTSLLPFIGLEAATGGIGGAGTGAKFLRTFTAAAATTFHDEYANAIAEGKPTSEAYKSAMATTAINSLAMAGAATPADIRKMINPKTSAGKLIASMSDEAIQKQLSKGVPKGFKGLAENLKGRMKDLPKQVSEGLKTGTRFEAYMAGANALNGREQDFKRSLVAIGEFGILGAGLGQLAHKTPTQLQKSAGLEFGKKPDEYAAVAEAMKRDGQLSQQEYDHRIDLINKYKEAYKNLPKADAKGNELSQRAKENYLYNEVIKNEGNRGKSTLPPKQAEKAEMTALVADHKNDLILEPKTDNQLESRKSQIEKQLEKKDENGKSELTDKERKDAEAELEAINQTIQERKDTTEAEEKLPKLSQPIEGVDEFGVPIGENVPPVTKPTDVPQNKFEYKEESRDSQEGNPVVAYELKVNGVDQKDLIEIIQNKDEGYTFSSVSINKDLIGKGIGKDLYRDVNKKSIEDTGKPLWANEKNLSEDAKRVWESLVKTGEAEKTDIGYRFKSADLAGGENQKINPYKDILENGTPEQRDQALKEISDQWHDPRSRKLIEEVVPKEVINEAKTKYPQEETTLEIQQPAEIEGASNIEPAEVALPAEEGAGGPFIEGKRTILSHRGLQEIATEFALPDIVSRERKSDPQLFNDAKQTIDKWVEDGVYQQKISGLVEKAENAEVLTDEQRVILQQHIANVRNEVASMDINSPEYNQKLQELQRVVRAGETTRSAAGAALRVPYMASTPNDLPTMMLKEMEVSGVSELTENQKQTVQKEFEQMDAAEKAYQQKIQALEAENAKLRASRKLSEAKSTTPKSKKTKNDFIQEREGIKKSILEKWNKSKNVGIVQDHKNDLLIQIAPDVAKLMKSYVEEGVIKLEELVAKIKDDLKDFIPDLREKDVHDIIAGVYNEKKKTKNQIAEQIENIRIQAKLVNKLEQILQGKEPKEEKIRIKRTAEIERLRKQINDLRKEISDAEKEPPQKLSPEERALKSLKSKMQNEITNLQEQIRSGNYEKPEKKEPIKLDKEALELRDKVINLRRNRELRLLLQQRQNETGKQKASRLVVEALNIPRTLMTIGDFSGLLRQDIFFAAGHPLKTAAATKEMFKSAFSQKIYDRWFADLKEDPRYDIMQKSRLSISDSLNHDLTKREEDFMSSLSEKIPIIGKTIVKGSERSYTALLNKSRVDMFNYFADKMEERGVTFENNPKAYKAMAEYINNATGRSDFGETLNRVAPVLNSIFFSPRLIASRVNMLTYWMQPRFWKTLPKEVRIDYMRNWFSLLAIGGTIMALSKAGGAEVEDDPRSSDFGKIKSGNTRWDMWGGAQPYMRVLAQIATGQRKSTNTGKIYDLNGDDIFGETRAGVVTDFFRNKLAPVPGAAVDILSGRTSVGDKIVYQVGGAKDKEVSLGQYVLQRILPMTITGTYEAMKDQGPKALLTVGVPSTFGVGTQTYEPSKPKRGKNRPKKPMKKPNKSQ